MPATTEAGYVIGIKIRGGSTGQVSISAINGRTGQIKRLFSSNNEAKVNLNNTKDFPSGYANGDVIEVVGTGLKTGSAIHTVDKARGGGTVNLTMTDVSTTNAPAVTIG